MNITNSHNSNIPSYLPVTPHELRKIKSICMSNIDFQHLSFGNTPKDRSKYILDKASSLLDQFEREGERIDFVIFECFRRTLENIIPHPTEVRGSTPKSPPPITTKDWWEVFLTLLATPDDVFKRHFSGHS